MGTLGDLNEQAKAHREKMERVIFVKEEHIVIDLNELCGAPSEYNIPLNECTSSTQILSWVYHLSEKTWLTTEVLRRFVALAVTEAGIKIHKE